MVQSAEIAFVESTRIKPYYERLVDVVRAKVTSKRTETPRKRAESAKARSHKKKADLREPPSGGKPLQTYERLIAATGELLAEVGFERLTTNAICARASLSPPAFYHYFDDKYEILEVMARRLLKRQNDAYAAWLFKGGAWSSPDKAVEALEEWFAIATEITHSEPGAIWTMRALRALPNLAHVRLESQRQSTDQMFAFYRRLLPEIDPTVLWCRLRIRSEFGWAVDELALEEDRVPKAILLREAARILAISLRDEEWK
jgi:AcrR family transcriptional regulator